MSGPNVAFRSCTVCGLITPDRCLASHALCRHCQAIKFPCPICVNGNAAAILERLRGTPPHEGEMENTL